MARLSWLVVFLLLVGGIAAKSFYWEHVQVDMQLLPNGDVHVQEHHTLIFLGDTFTFGYRTIPLGVFGCNDGIEELQVTEDGNHLMFQTSRRDDNLRVDWYFPPSTGRHKYTFSYKAKSAVRVGSSPQGGDQLFWKAIPPEHPAEIRRATVTVTLPDNVQLQRNIHGQHLVTSYVEGRESNLVRIDISNGDKYLVFDYPYRLAANEMFEIRLQFAPIPGSAAFALPTWQRDERKADVIALCLIIFFLAMPLLPILYRRRIPHSNIGPVQYTPTLTNPPQLASLSPAEAGMLLTNNASIKHVLATLVDLSRRGYLVIHEYSDTWYFTRTAKPLVDCRNYEEQLITLVADRTLSSLQYEFAPKLKKLYSDIWTSLRTHTPPIFVQGRAPDEVAKKITFFSGLLLLLGTFVVFFGIGLLPKSVQHVEPLLWLYALFGFGLTLLLVVVFGRSWFIVRTPHGEHVFREWKAFKGHFIDMTMSTTHGGGYHPYLDKVVFNQNLPYAVAFDVDHQWATRHWPVQDTSTTHGGGSANVIYVVPDWYYLGPPPTHYDAGISRATLMNEAVPAGTSIMSMSDRLSRMLNSTSTIFLSTPSSSSSSSSSSSWSSGSSGGGGSMGFG